MAQKILFIFIFVLTSIHLGCGGAGSRESSVAESEDDAPLKSMPAEKSDAGLASEESEPPVATISADAGTGFRVVKKSDSKSVPPTEKSRTRPTLDDLLVYVKSPDSAVRIQVARDLTAQADPRATRALEDILLHDKSMQVRLAALDGLVARNSVSSVRVMQRVVNTASTSSERARINRAINQLMGLK
ncbi:MAG: HEAT repeat domain-containing protein [Deltaproteobacteria bacterium]|nr:HEAT repeat domain-containing protein [Deltaproteobacteria bacterium]